MADEPVAPAENEGTDSGLYDLNSVPEELREHVEPHLKEITKNVDSRFREAADYRKQWEPFEQLGINQYDPEALQGLLQFAQMAEDDGQFAEWFENTGTESGLFEKLGYQKAETEEPLGGYEGMSPEQITQLVSEAVAKEMAPVNEQLTHQQEQQILSDAEQEVESHYAQLVEEHSLPEEARDPILRFAMSFAEDTNADVEAALKSGVEEYQRIVGQGESGLFAQKSSQPGPVEGPGSADTSAPKITTFDEAKAAAKERYRQSAAT